MCGSPCVLICKVKMLEFGGTAGNCGECSDSGDGLSGLPSQAATIPQGTFVWKGEGRFSLMDDGMASRRCPCETGNRCPFLQVAIALGQVLIWVSRAQVGFWPLSCMPLATCCPAQLRELGRPRAGFLCNLVTNFRRVFYTLSVHICGMGKAVLVCPREPLWEWSQQVWNATGMPGTK